MVGRNSSAQLNKFIACTCGKMRNTQEMLQLVAIWQYTRGAIIRD